MMFIPTSRVVVIGDPSLVPALALYWRSKGLAIGLASNSFNALFLESGFDDRSFLLMHIQSSISNLTLHLHASLVRLSCSSTSGVKYYIQKVSNVADFTLSSNIFLSVTLWHKTERPLPLSLRTYSLISRTEYFGNITHLPLKTYLIRSFQIIRFYDPLRTPFVSLDMFFLSSELPWFFSKWTKSYYLQ